MLIINLYKSCERSFFVKVAILFDSSLCRLILSNYANTAAIKAVEGYPPNATSNVVYREVLIRGNL